MDSPMGVGLARQAIDSKDNVVLAQGAIVSVASRGASGVLQLLTQILTARLLGPAGFGLWAVGITFIRALGVLLSWGFSEAIVRFGTGGLAEASSLGSRNTARLVRIGTSLGILGGMLLFLAAGWVSVTVFRKTELVPVFRVLAPALAAFAAIEVLAASTRLTKKMHHSALARDLGPAVLHLGLITVCVALSLGLIAASVATSVAYVFGAGLAWLIARRIRVRPGNLKSTRPTTSGVLRYAGIATLAGVFGFVVTRADLLFVGVFLDSASAGHYMAAVQFSLVFAVVMLAFSSVFAPMCSELFRASEIDRLQSLYRLSTRWALYVTVPFIVPLLIAAPDVLGLVYGEEFAIASTALRILLLGQLIQISVGLVYTLLMMAGGEVLWLRLSGFAAALGIALPIILVPRFGIVGAAASTMVTTFFLMASGLWAIRLRLGISPYNVRSIPVIFCAIASSLAAMLVRLLLDGHSVLGVTMAFAASLGATALVLAMCGPHEEDGELLIMLKDWTRRDVVS